MVLEDITTALGNGLSNPVAYWMAVAIIGGLIYFTIKGGTMPNSYAGAISFLITAIFLEIILKFIFGSIGIRIDYGVFTLKVPLINDIVITDFVMGMRLMSFVFDFGFFINIGMPFYIEFMKNVPAIPVMPTWFSMLVFLYVSSDSIIEFVFFYYFFYSIMIIAGDSISGSVKNSKMYALVLALVPVALYNYFISNPFIEYPKAMDSLSGVVYFFNNAPALSQVIFFGTLVISFLVVATVLAVIIDLLYGTGAATIRPSWETKKWQSSYFGIGMGYTIAFAILYSLKGISWYIFFPGVILYSLFKKYPVV